MRLKYLRRVFFVLLQAAITLSLLNDSFAAHPLITDDTGTMGKGKYLLEVSGEYSHKEDREYDESSGQWFKIQTTSKRTTAVFLYGITEKVDVIFGLPYKWTKSSINDVTDPLDKVEGMEDIFLELKWRFSDKDGLSLALKPCLTLPTGDEKKGLGLGRPAYGLTFIATKKLDPWSFHLNLGYNYREYKLDTDQEAFRKDIWNVSFATEVEVIEDLKLIANIGMERNPDKTSNIHPAFLLGGFIYSVTERLGLSLGIKGGLNKAEMDYVAKAGITWSF